jgi:putative membrane protein (TIGR04086 family)
MKTREKRKEESGERWLAILSDLLKGGVLAGVVTVLVLLLCAWLMSAGVLREQWIEGIVLAACVLGAALGGSYAVYQVGRSPLPVGLGVGAVLFFLLATAGFLAIDGGSVGQNGAVTLCACLCGGAIAGFLGRKPKKKRKR